MLSIDYIAKSTKLKNKFHEIKKKDGNVHLKQIILIIPVCVYEKIYSLEI